MKNLLIGLAMLLSLGINTSLAGAPTTEKSNSVSSIRSEIISNISAPSFLTQNNSANDVKAVVQINENGNLLVHEISSDNPMLKNYVMVSLKNMKVNRNASEKFVVLIHFKNY